jgi:hypothetical protein
MRKIILISMGLIPRGLPRVVIPAKAGIQEFKLDAGSLAQTVIKERSF